jgi:hypothetical protein
MPHEHGHLPGVAANRGVETAQESRQKICPAQSDPSDESL